MLIGITGKKGHGKDALAAPMAAAIGAHRMAFADELKRIVMELYGLSYEQCFGALKEEVDPRWGLSPRVIMQRFGTEVARSVHPDTWVRKLAADVERFRKGWKWGWEPHPGRWVARYVGPTTRAVIVPDVRFANEAAWIKQEGGILVRVVRPGSVASGIGSGHASETAQDDLVVDYEVLNDRDLRALAEQGVKLAEMINRGSV